MAATTSKINKLIKASYLILGLVFVLSIFVPTNFALATCNPVIANFSMSPSSTTIQKPLVKVLIKINGISSCTDAEKQNLILYISADGVDSDVNLPSPLQYLFPNPQGDFTLNIDFPDPFTPDGKSERLNWPTISYKAYIAKKGNVTAVSPEVVSTSDHSVIIANGSYVDPSVTPATTTPVATTTAPAATSSSYASRPYDGVDWAGTLTITNHTGQTDIAGLITKLINWLLLIIAMVATVVIIISGIMLVFNGGSETVVKKAKNTILWAIIGLVVSVGAFALINIIQSLL